MPKGGARAGSGPPKAENTLKREWYINRWFEVVTRDDHDAIIAEVLSQARAGKEWAVKLYLDRLQGKVPQPLEHTGDPEQPLHVVIRSNRGRRSPKAAE